MISSSDILKASILIVDDQQANILLLEEMLREAGYTSISSTRNPHEVCELHRANRYSLILLDLQMPGLDGFQVMESLKALEANCYLPVLVITAQPDHKLRALRAGAKDFVSKPFDLAEVLMRVHNLLEVRLLHLESEARTEKAEGRFIEAQKMDSIGQLAGGVAHDFNNIIAVILGYSDLVMEKLGSDTAVKSDLVTIRSAAERAAGLTRQLLIFSRKQSVQLAVLDLNEVVNDLDKMLRRLMHENIEITIVPGQKTGNIKSDSGYVGQVLLNLVVNARDAMPHGGKITIATQNVTLDETHARDHGGTNPGDYVMLSVSDTGTGMTKEVKARLFETFFTTKPVGKGTGLGLATCQTIVHQSGGHIQVHSEVGRGTTFKVYFPRAEQPLDVEARVLRSEPLPRGTETLFVVEDEPSVRHLACVVLQGQGYEVLSASNGEEALQMACDHKGAAIQLVITDVIMPLMGGKVMAEWLTLTYPEMKILFTSGYTDDAISHHGVLEKGVEFLPKPYTPATLIRKVRELLDQSNTPMQAVAESTNRANPPAVPRSDLIVQDGVLKADDLATAAWPASAPLPRQTDHPPRILTVEDDGGILQLNAAMLMGASFRVDTAEDGAAAWDLVQLNHYDLLITDNDMPKMSGVELLKKIHSAGKWMPVIMATGSLPKEAFIRHPWLKSAVVLTKPYTSVELLGAVKEALRATGAAREQIAPPAAGLQL